MKRITKYLLILTTVLLINFQVEANGGPVDSNCLIESGNIKFINESDIRILKENLDIKLELEKIHVLVEYELLNEGQAKKVDYVFPVTMIGNEHQSLNTVKNFKAVDGKKELVHYAQSQGDDKLNEHYDRIRNQYYIMSLDFANEEKKVLKIEYELSPEYLDWANSKSPMIYYDDKSFAYDLSPAENWGQGIINEFNLKIDSSMIKELGGSVTACSFREIDTQQAIMAYHQNNFKLEDHKELTLTYELDDYYTNSFLKENLLKSEDVNITTSSNLDDIKYSPEKMMDQNNQTTWAEGNSEDGVGEWIVLEFKEPVYIDFFLIKNGFYASEDLYYKNSRIKSLDIEITTIDPVNGKQIKRYTDEFRDIAFDDSNGEYSRVSGIPYGDKITKIKMIIGDVYPGTKYKDVCITDLRLFGRKVKEEPKKMGKIDDYFLVVSVDSGYYRKVDTLFIKKDDSFRIKPVFLSNGEYYSEADGIYLDGEYITPLPLKKSLPLDNYQIKPVFKAYNNLREKDGVDMYDYSVPITYEVKAFQKDTITNEDINLIGTNYVGINVPVLYDCSQSLNNNQFNTKDILHKEYNGKIMQIVIRRDDTYISYLEELMNTPFIYVPKYIKGVHQTDERIGSDCAEFAIYGFRRMGINIPYCGPYTVKEFAEDVGGEIYLDRSNDALIYRDRERKPILIGKGGIKVGDIVHFEEQVSVLYDDRGLKGVLDANDLIIQSYNNTPEIIKIKESEFYQNRIKILRLYDVDKMKQLIEEVHKER